MGNKVTLKNCPIKLQELSKFSMYRRTTFVGFKRGRDGGYAPIKRVKYNSVPQKMQRSQRQMRTLARAILNRRTGGFIGIEKKYFDSGVSNVSLSADPNATGLEVDPATVNCLNAIDVGNTQTTRDGSHYIIKSLFLKGTLFVAAQANQTALDVAPDYFIAVVQDTQTNGAQLNSEDVFTNPVAGVATCMFRNLQYSSRFKVLWSTKVRGRPVTVTYDGTNIEQGGYTQFFECSLPKLNIKVQCKGTGNGVADIVDNSLHVIACTSSQNTTPSIYYNSRIRFVG